MCSEMNFAVVDEDSIFYCLVSCFEIFFVDFDHYDSFSGGGLLNGLRQASGRFLTKIDSATIGTGKIKEDASVESRKNVRFRRNSH